MLNYCFIIVSIYMNIDVFWNEKFKCFLEGLYFRLSICKNKYLDVFMEGDIKN